MLGELFAIGTFWFWALIVSEIILLFIFTENENGFAATVSLAVFAAALQWLGGVDIIGFVINEPIKFLVICVCYFMAGTLWATVKWWIHVKDRIDDIKEYGEEWAKRNGHSYPPAAGTAQAEAWKEERQRKGLIKPLIRQHKADFMRWMTFWWISMIWSLFADFVKRICKEIYRKIAKFLQTMADNMWRKAGLDPDEDD